MITMIHPVPERDPQSSASQEVLPSEQSPFPSANSVGIMAGSGFLMALFRGQVVPPTGSSTSALQSGEVVSFGGWLSEQRFSRVTGILLGIQAASQVRVTHQSSVNLKWWFPVPQGGAVQSC